MSAPNISTKSKDQQRLEDLLIQSGLVNQADLTNAAAEAQKAGQDLGDLLVRKGLVNRDQYGQALSTLHNMRYVNLSKLEIDPKILDLFPEEFMREKKIIPVAHNGGRLVVALVNPMDRSAIDEVTFITGMRPQTVVTTPFDFQEFYQKHLSDRSANTLIEEIATHQDASGSEDADIFRQQRDAEMTDSSNPLVKLVNSIMEEAIERNASDIHVEPRNRKYLVRFRIDGVLRTVLDIPQNMEASFVTRIKVMSRMDIAEHRRPQDGRIGIKYRNSDYNLRVNTLPVSDGREKIVIRILRPAKNITDFSALGFDATETEKLESLYKAPYGIVLVCGPTGSGKTTTLYTVLKKINDDSRNISTVEDPVELTIEGLNQSQVNPKADYTFATSMRALLRQDPDVIMVGEIRDYETLEAAIHASLTGHLVFSTIHSNSTAATITRMIEMGASANLIATALIGVVAQRLIRLICPHCKQPYTATLEEKKQLFPYNEEKQAQEITLYRGEGCDLCSNTGYTGRVGVYEILTLNREIQQLVSTSGTDLEIEDAAVASGMKTIQMSGLEKVLSGASSLEEVTRVLGLNRMH